MLGTHTHVPTADEQILPGGTAFISDVGMTGPYDSILGRRIDRVLSTTVTFVPSAFDVATGDPRLAGRWWTSMRRPAKARPSAASCATRPSSRSEETEPRPSWRAGGVNPLYVPQGVYTLRSPGCSDWCLRTIRSIFSRGAADG